MTIDIISIYDCLEIESDKKSVFVLSPFKEDRTKIYERFVKPLVEEAGYECVRADDLATNTNKLNEIVRQIWNSQFIIADITGFNANVMYEIGFAHAMQKEVIMIYEKTLDKSELPFDTQYIDTILYDSNPTGGYTLREKLKKTIEHVEGKIVNPDKKEIKQRIKENEEYDYKYSIISNFEIRKKRIDYFTRIAISHLCNLKHQHETLLADMNECAQEANEKNLDKVVHWADFTLGTNKYVEDFVKYLINNSSNFIANPWIVNKFPEYFSIFSMGLGRVKTSSLFSYEDYNSRKSLDESIERNISDLDMCIKSLNEERKLVGLKEEQNTINPMS